MRNSRRLEWVRVCAVVFFVIVAGSLQARAQRVREVEDRPMKEAADNIEKYRNRDVSIRLLMPDGKAPQGGNVEVGQTRHDFLFGCIVFDLNRDERFKRDFNCGVFHSTGRITSSGRGRSGWADLIPVLE
jgi:hypothetical protein